MKSLWLVALKLKALHVSGVFFLACRRIRTEQIALFAFSINMSPCKIVTQAAK